MFEWSPDKTLSWSEPVRVRRHFYPNRYLKSWIPAAITLVPVALWMLLWVYIQRPGSDPVQDFILCLCFGLGTGLAFGYGIGALVQLGSTQISIDHGGIERASPISIHLIHFGIVGLILMAMGKGRKRWAWSEIHGCRVMPYDFKGKTIDVLELLNADQQPIAYAGLGRKLKRERLDQSLAYHKCPLIAEETQTPAA